MKNRFDKLVAVLLALALLGTTYVVPVFAEEVEAEVMPEAAEELVLEAEEPAPAEIEEAEPDNPEESTPEAEEPAPVETEEAEPEATESEEASVESSAPNPVEETTEDGEADDEPSEEIVFTGELTAASILADALHIGDLVTLQATVLNANAEYSLK